jgi:asparagine synthase (glutamine-hydrolysing)
MCGIAGFNFEDRELLKKMMDSLSHRGPDQRGGIIYNNFSLGHLRLSIIDLSENGRQPMSNEEGNLWVVYNGEIYNFKEIKEDLEKKGHRFKSNTDSEVIVHAYEEYGPDCVNLFNGMFAFAIWDGKKLFLARDPVGIKPLYYYFDDKNFIFASEIKTILKADIKVNGDYDSVDKLLS